MHQLIHLKISHNRFRSWLRRETIQVVYLPWWRYSSLAFSCKIIQDVHKLISHFPDDNLWLIISYENCSILFWMPLKLGYGYSGVNKRCDGHVFVMVRRMKPIRMCRGLHLKDEWMNVDCILQQPSTFYPALVSLSALRLIFVLLYSLCQQLQSSHPIRNTNFIKIRYDGHGIRGNSVGELCNVKKHSMGLLPDT